MVFGRIVLLLAGICGRWLGASFQRELYPMFCLATDPRNFNEWTTEGCDCEHGLSQRHIIGARNRISRLLSSQCRQLFHLFNTIL
jgi:hypothetical protein